MPRFLRHSSGIAALAVTVLASGSAAAAAGEWHAGARAGIATLTGHTLGPALELHGAYELGDVFDVVVQGIGSRQTSSRVDLLSASGGLVYKIDVFEWIPYAGLEGGYYRASAPGGGAEGRGGFSLHAGLDYLPMREMALGVDFGWHTIVHADSSAYFTVLAGAEYRFGW